MRGGGESTDKEEGNTLLSVPSPPLPQELSSNSALLGVVNFCHFFSCTGCYDPAKEVWDRLHKVEDKFRCFTVPLFPSVSSLHDQANVVGAHFAAVSNSSNYFRAFLKFNTDAAIMKVSLAGVASAPYNQPFTMVKLQMTLKVRKRLSPCPD